MHIRNGMPENEDARKYIAKYVEDLHSLISHGLQPVSHQVGQANTRDHVDAAQLIADLHEMLQRHERLLQLRLDALGSSPTTAIQDAAASVAGFVAGVYNHVRSEAVSKSVRDDYTFVSHCAVSWLMLMSTARSLGDHETEELAEQGYRDCARLVMRIDQLMPALVLQELEQDGFAARPVSDWATTIVSSAWAREDLGRRAA
jgi:hypothetical protein